jgi:hypothetical protein
MKLFTTTLIGAFLSQMGAAHADDKPYNKIIYTNKTTVPLSFEISPRTLFCVSVNPPREFTVQPGQSVGPYYIEDLDCQSNNPYHGVDRGLDMTLFILKPGSNALIDKWLSQCVVNRDSFYGTMSILKCDGYMGPPVTINTDVANVTTEIVVGPFTQNSLVKKQLSNSMVPSHHALPNLNMTHPLMTHPHAGHEVEHYNTSRVNPMMNQHKMEFHRTEPMMSNRKIEGHKEAPKIHPLKK